MTMNCKLQFVVLLAILAMHVGWGDPLPPRRMPTSKETRVPGSRAKENVRSAVLKPQHDAPSVRQAVPSPASGQGPSTRKNALKAGIVICNLCPLPEEILPCKVSKRRTSVRFGNLSVAVKPEENFALDCRAFQTTFTFVCGCERPIQIPTFPPILLQGEQKIISYIPVYVLAPKIRIKWNEVIVTP